MRLQRTSGLATEIFDNPSIPCSFEGVEAFFVDEQIANVTAVQSASYVLAAAFLTSALSFEKAISIVARQGIARQCPGREGLGRARTVAGWRGKKSVQWTVFPEQRNQAPRSCSSSAAFWLLWLDRLSRMTTSPLRSVGASWVST